MWTKVSGEPVRSFGKQNVSYKSSNDCFREAVEHIATAVMGRKRMGCIQTWLSLPPETGRGGFLSVCFGEARSLAASRRALVGQAQPVSSALGLVPWLNQSGETERIGRNSRCGDAMMRGLLSEAATALLTRVRTWSWLKAWAVNLAQAARHETGHRRAVPALGRHSSPHLGRRKRVPMETGNGMSRL